MKTLRLCKSFIMTALLLTLGGGLTGCLKNEDQQLGEVPEIKLSESTLNFTLMPTEPKSFHIDLKGAGAWTIEALDVDPDAVEIQPSYGTTNADVEIMPSPTDAPRQIKLQVSLFGEIVGRQILVAKETVFVNQTADGSTIEPNDGLSPETAFTVEEAIAKAKEIGDVNSEETYYIKGVISSVTEAFSAQYGNGTFEMTDKNKSDVFTAYRILYLGNKKWTTGDTNVKVGDEVIVCGKIINFKGNTPETAQGSAYLYMLNGVTSSDGSGDGGDDTPGGDDSNLSGFESQSAFVASGTNTTDYWYNIDGYTMNGQNATGVKLGKSGTSGVYTTSAVGVTGDKVLSLYGVAWSGKSATLYIRVNGGGEVDGASSTALKANSTATGSGALALTVTDDDYYTFKLKNLTASSTITLATTDNFAAAEVEGRAILARIRLTDTDEGPETGSGSGSGGGDDEPAPEGTGATPDSPFNVAQILAKAKSLGENEKSAESYYFKGKVSSITENYGTEFGNATYYITDASTTETFYVYRSLYLGNVKYTSGTLLKEGDKVVVYGKVTNYKGNTPETVTNESYLYSLNADEGGEGGDKPEPEAAFVKAGSVTPSPIPADGGEVKVAYTYGNLPEGAEIQGYYTIGTTSGSLVKGVSADGAGTLTFTIDKNADTSEREIKFTIVVYEKGAFEAMKDVTATTTAKQSGASVELDAENSFDFTKQGYSNQQDITKITFPNGATLTFDGGGNSNNTPKYYTSGTAVRCYAKNTLTFDGNGKKIVRVKFYYGSRNDAMTADSGDLNSDNTEWTGKASTVTFTVPEKSATVTNNNGEPSAGQAHFTAIEVYLEDDGQGGTEPDQPKDPEFAFESMTPAETETLAAEGGDITISYTYANLSSTVTDKYAIGGYYVIDDKSTPVTDGTLDDSGKGSIKFTIPANEDTAEREVELYVQVLKNSAPDSKLTAIEKTIKQAGKVETKEEIKVSAVKAEYNEGTQDVDFSASFTGDKNDITKAEFVWTPAVATRAAVGGRVDATIGDGTLTASAKVEPGNYTVSVEINGETAASGDASTTTPSVNVPEPKDETGLTPENPFTVAQAIAKAKETGETETDDVYYIKGLISSITQTFAASGTYGNATFLMIDKGTPADTFTAYRILYKDNEKWTSSNDDVNIGDEVIVCGKIVTYNGVYETLTGSGYLYDFVQHAPTISNVIATVGDDGTSVTFKATYTNKSNVTITKAGFKYGEKDESVTAPTGTSGEITATVSGLAPATYTVKAYLDELESASAVTFTINDPSADKEDPVTYTVDFKNMSSQASANTNSYVSGSFNMNVTATEIWTITNGNNNNKAWNYVKFGQKSNTNNTGSIATKWAVDASIATVTTNVQKLAANATTTVKLIVAQDDSFTSIVKEYDAQNISTTAGDITFIIDAPQKGCYYKLEYFSNNSTTTNGSIQVNSVTLKN